MSDGITPTGDQKWVPPPHLGGAVCPHQNACNFVGFCLKDQDASKFGAGEGMGWFDMSYRYGPRAGFTEDVGIYGGVKVEGMPGFGPPQFYPGLFREGEWILSGASVFKDSKVG